MANNKGKRNSRKKRNRGGGGSGIVGLTKTPAIIPSMWRGKMFFNTVLQAGPPAGAMAVNVFRTNSIFDPDFTGGGTTAFAYYQLSSLYGRYRVLGFHSKIMFVNTSSTVPLTCLIAVNPVNTIGTNFTNACAQRHVWTKCISTSVGAGATEHEVGGKIGKFYGVPARQVREEDDFAAVVGSNPNNVVYMHIGVYSNALAGTANIHVRMEFDVVWSLPLEMA